MTKCPGLADKVISLYQNGVKSFKDLQAHPEILRLAKQGMITEKQIKTVLVKAKIDPVDAAASSTGKGMIYSFIFQRTTMNCR